MAVVADSSPLILFAKIGRWELLRDLYAQLIVPPAVWGEVVLRQPGRVGAAEVAGSSWISVRSAEGIEALPALREELDPGEAEVLALASAMARPIAVLLDDRRGRRRATAMGIEVVGSAGAVAAAKQMGLIRQVKPLFDDLRVAGLHLSEVAYRSVVASGGE